MKIKSTHLIMFSPTDSTKTILQRIGAQLSPSPAEMNLTLPASSPASCHFLPNDLAVFGVPVYGGRVPATARERFASLRGDRTPAVIVVTYGNRAYEDALSELKDTVEAQGFKVIAAAAFVTEHSIIREIAAGRPDASDLKAIDEFGRAVTEKMKTYSPSAEKPLGVPGNREYKPYMPIPMHPKTKSGCTGCGTCAAQCPVEAISKENPKQMDESLCISCMRCVRVCPNSARRLPMLVMWGAKKKILPKCKERREAETFF